MDNRNDHVYRNHQDEGPRNPKEDCRGQFYPSSRIGNLWRSPAGNRTDINQSAFLDIKTKPGCADKGDSPRPANCFSLHGQLSP